MVKRERSDPEQEQVRVQKRQVGILRVRVLQRRILPDPKKVADVVNLETPSTASKVCSLLGLTNYCSRFVPDYATKTEPLHKLTYKDQRWCWTKEHDRAVSELKKALVSAPVTTYFDPEKDTVISVDASPVGLAAILSQVDPETEESHVITHASRSLTATEEPYNQTEPKALAVVWACEHLHLYVEEQNHSTTRVAPATALFGRPMKTKLPEVTAPCSDADIRQRDQAVKAKMKEYADNMRYVKPSAVKEGDDVLVKRDETKKKSDTPYDPKPRTVVETKGSMVFKSVPVEKEEFSSEEQENSADGGIQSQSNDAPARRYPQCMRTRPTKLADYVCD